MRQALRLVLMLVVSVVCLQIFFAARIALMGALPPQSTSFQRSEAMRLLREKGEILWAQHWVDDDQISVHLKRAVIASEDASFNEHNGVDWDALEKAWERNQKEQERVEKRILRLAQGEKRAARPAQVASTKPPPVAKIVGGSTITQQLAKNLFLSSERTMVRKAQEFVLTFMLEALLDKRRILEIYLNNVEWGEGIFGAQASARHYFRVDASRLSPNQAARLAVMLPAPKRFEKLPRSAYVNGRAGTIEARMGGVELP
ncbi:transglycosylase domain-containing protein [Roseateles amylovorans]|jgi:monofunctional glycosyltransferase|uniref:Biosynthetic peptidoglycan transglycosylase n=1 Tax=Roseateles amylovorans TaxID=2978473 RepID=A0ABY6AYR9_9BURK|nr:transglycosylase domain-containing protein [Roseateles amylovorans]UXH77730.1 transglycosylase domain-containing protein [Roseateles amylovorans]